MAGGRLVRGQGKSWQACGAKVPCCRHEGCVAGCQNRQKWWPCVYDRGDGGGGQRPTQLKTPLLTPHPQAQTPIHNKQTSPKQNKLIPSYDLEVRVSWAGELTDGDGKVVGGATGKLHLPHIGGAGGRRRRVQEEGGKAAGRGSGGSGDGRARDI